MAFLFSLSLLLHCTTTHCTTIVEGEPVQVVIVDPIHTQPLIERLTRLGSTTLYKRLERLAIKESLSQSKRLKLPNGETITLVLDTNSAWRCFAESVSNTKAPIFHWTSYDATHLKKEAPPEVREALLPRLHDLCKSFDSAVKMPIKGKSLKTVGAYLGFAWRGYDDWGAAYVDYQKWLNSHDLNALASACVYQQDDVTAMMVVRRWLVENAPHELK